MIIAVCKYVVNRAAFIVGRVICGMKLLERTFSRNSFTPVFFMYLMRFQLKLYVMIGLFCNQSSPFDVCNHTHTQFDACKK